MSRQGASDYTDHDRTTDFMLFVVENMSHHSLDLLQLIII